MTAQRLSVNEATITILMQPPSACNPNHRRYWRERHKAAKEARLEAGKATQVAVLEDLWAFAWVTSAPEIIVDIEIAWHGRRQTLDHDNAIGSCKPFLDGIAEVLQINDRKFRIGEVRQGRGEGMVVFTLREAA